MFARSKKKNRDGGRFSLVWLVSIPVLLLISILLFLMLWDGMERQVVDINLKLPSSIQMETGDLLEPLTAEDYANILGD